jgi:hypothetical protein
MSHRRGVLALLALLALVLTGCGVRAQDHPSPVEVAAPAASGRTGARTGGSAVVEVHFVRGPRLEAVPRPARELSPQAALELLVTGPDRGQVAAGIRTALAPQRLTVMPQAGAPAGTAVVAASRDFAGVSGNDQLLAVAQVVWTVTGVGGVQRVQVTVDGAPVEVPTDAGLSRGPVTRADYASVAPRAAPASSTRSSPTPATRSAPGATGGTP